MVALYVIVGYVLRTLHILPEDSRLTVKIVSHPSSIQRRAHWHRFPNNLILFDTFPLYYMYFLIA